MKRLTSTLVVLTLTACSNASGSSDATGTPTAGNIAEATGQILETKAGRYRVEMGKKIDPATLPSNADLKMLDGNLAKFAAHLCDFDIGEKLAADRCDVYVQPDPKGLMVGYATLIQRYTVSIETDIQTDPQRGGLGCFVAGDLVNNDFDHPEAKIDVGKDFSARIGFSAWQKSPDNWMVSPGDEDGNPNSARGMWYIKRVNDNLRINQERWNYCYKGSDIYIDEVFGRLVSLVRVAPDA